MIKTIKGFGRNGRKYYISSKKKWISEVILLLFVTVLVFKSEMMSYYYYYMKYKSPVEFNNVEITFPKDIVYSKSDKSINFVHWKKPYAFLNIGKIDLNKIDKNYLTNCFENRGFVVIDVQDLSYRGFQSFSISYMDTSWEYNKSIFIVPKNTKITYTGSKKMYNDCFKEIVDAIEFSQGTGMGMTGDSDNS